MAGMPMTMVGDAGEDGNAVAQQTFQPVEDARHGTATADQYADLRRTALANVDPEQHSRHTILKRKGEEGNQQNVEALDLDSELTRLQLEAIVEQALQTPDQDCQGFLERVRERLDRVGVNRPTVEVRFQDVTAQARVFKDQSRNIPNLLNFLTSALQSLTSGITRASGTMQLTILDHVSGVLKPGSLTLLLGPPASGKTTLLKALSGRLEHSNLTRSGQVTYNGRPFKDFRVQRTAAFIEQDDMGHMGELTVTETFDFAARCMGSATKKEDLATLRTLEKQNQVEPDWNVNAYMRTEATENHRQSVLTNFVIRMLGLGICADTEVGNAMRRGVSGGQKKRVTSGEQMVGPKRVVFGDEISTGLDSSTTYQIIKWLRDTCHTQLDTMLIALLQPAPETWELFDDVILMAEGHIVYHGPIQQVQDFFGSMGFVCPERKGVADFLQEVVSKNDQQQYHSKEWGEPWRYVPCREMSDNFKQFHVGQAMHGRLAAPMSPEQQQQNDRALMRSKYALSGMNMLRACMDREVLLVKRNLFLYGFRTVQSIIISIFVVVTFFHSRMPHNTVNDGGRYFSLLFFSLLVCMFDGITELNLTVDRLPGFYRQRDNRFYSTFAFTTPVTLLRIPYSFGIALVWSVIVYYPTNLAPEASRFFTFLLILFLLHNMGVSMFRAISSAARHEVTSLISGCFFFLALLLLGGFLLPRYQTPIWVKWVIYTDPVWYVQSALAINEFKAPRWQREIVTTGTYAGHTVGDAVMLNRGIVPHTWFLWLSVGVIIAWLAVYCIVTQLLSEFLNPLGGSNPGLPPHVLAAMQEQEGAGPGHKGTSKVLPAEGAAAATTGGATTGSSKGSFRSRATKQEAAGDALSSFRQSGQSTKNLDSAQDYHLGAVPNSQRGMGNNTKGMVLPFQPLALTFHHMNYYVTMPKAMDTTDPEKLGPKPADVDGVTMLQLLNDCSGIFRPGVLTALVGSSGAGKTTLMDVLAGRKTAGKFTGDITVGGFPKDQKSFARVAGYVEQTDIHAPLTTVHEALMFSAALRVGDVDAKTREAFVNEIEELVELKPLHTSLVGIPGRSGLSVEQRKRLTIAVELVANPSIIFMDEPTSGLDARAAAIVMRTVRNTVNTGRTVVCTIHQPSIDVFEAFDELLLMKIGGQVIYGGELGTRSNKLVSYFEAIQGVPKLAQGLNPATWALQVSTPGMEKAVGVDFAKIFQDSGMHANNIKLIEQESQPKEGAKPIAFTKQYTRSGWGQFVELSKRNYKQYWRNVPYNGTRFAFGTVIALILGCILWGIGSKRSEVQQFQDILGALYLSVLFLGIINAMSVQSIVFFERTVLYREHAAGAYSKMPFALALCCVEIPYNTVETFLFSLISYFMIQFITSAAKFFWYSLAIWLILNIMTFYGIFGVFTTPDLPSAAVLSSFSYSFWNLFAGFVVPWATIPWWTRWIWYVNPVQWGLYLIIVTQLGDLNDEIITNTDGSQSTIPAYLSTNYNYQFSFHWQVVGILLGFAGVFLIMCVVGLLSFNFQSR